MNFLLSPLSHKNLFSIKLNLNERGAGGELYKRPITDYRLLNTEH